ncbi:DUF5367 family protein [Salinigranum halophilum]|uniref:DUF5367 family protein n=1 Tax=Salinigranum halophilum TaxID=2565931 RepID=UPI0010A8C337|nr:DUF5367 family protein [Salinigranum halophilum]
MSLDRTTSRWLILWGLSVWFAVAILIRLAGHVLLSPTNTLLLTAFFLSVIPLMLSVTYPVYWWLGLSTDAQRIAAALMSIPGMFLDVLLVLFAETVFPAMATEAVVHFGAILLFGYAIVLLTGFVPLRR